MLRATAKRLALVAASVLFTVASLAIGDDFAIAFPEREPPGKYRPERDFLATSSLYRVQEKHRARVEYASGRVVTLLRAQGRGVDKDGKVVIMLSSDNRTLHVPLAGIQQSVPEGYTHEQTYGWQGGPLVDHTAKDRPVS